MIAAIVAMDDERAIGRIGQLPWRIPDDMKRFRELTTGGTVVMGRKTYESLPTKFRPLPNRKNIVLTHKPELLEVPAEVSVISTIDECSRTVRKIASTSSVWIIGGAEIYSQTMTLWDRVYLTVVPGTHQGDVFLPPFENDFVLVSSEQCSDHSFKVYERKLKEGQ